MARQKTGLNVARRRKEDGSVVEYFYDRETGLFLGHDRAEAVHKLTQTSIAALQPGTIGKLVSEYRASIHYRTKLAPKTRKEYGRYLDIIQKEWGDLPVKALKPGHIERIKALYEGTPRAANFLISVFRILLSLAVKWQWIPSNPAADPGLIPIAPRTTVWTADDEQRFLTAAPDTLRLAFALMLYTVQRPADVLAMTTGQITERDDRLWIALRQQKTGELVDVPIHSRLLPYVQNRLANQTGLLLVQSPKGLPWRYRNMARTWDATAHKAGLEGLQRRDLRRTGIVRMAEAGATIPQIAAVSGHGIDYCAKIIETYLPRRSEVALGGIGVWEKGTVNRTIVPFRKTH